MHIIYSTQSPPKTFSKSIFLAGPSPRNADHDNWRIEALSILKEMDYDGVVFIPLPEDGAWSHRYDDQVEWENTYLNMADLVVFWVPRDLERLPAFTTNVEFGMWFDSGKAILGYPKDAPKMGYLAHHACKQHVSTAHTLKDTLSLAVTRLGDGEARSDGEREIPLCIWKTPHFQSWHSAQKSAGNRLDGAQVVWTFHIGSKNDPIFFWALHVNMYIEREKRYKINEVVISRPDTSMVVAYKRDKNLLESTIVLIREFRSPASTSDGFIREVPGGSSWKMDDEPKEIASQELSEETGLTIDSKRLRFIGTRQVSGTLSAQKACVYACEVTNQELTYLHSQADIAHGVVEDTEQTYVEIHQLKDLLKSESNTLDWSNLGMILTALLLERDR